MSIMNQIRNLLVEKVDVNDMPGMPRDPNAEYIKPLCVFAPNTGPRMSYRR